MTDLRPYQRDAVRALLDALRSDRSALLTMATGLGKTVVLSELVRLGFSRGRRVLLLAHRKELLTQAAEKFTRQAPGLRVGLERGSDRVNPADLPDVVVASVQSLQRAERLGRLPADAFALILIDEAHHAVAEGYRRIVRHFQGSKVVGVTATADRLDGAALGEVFGQAPFSYSIREAIGDGWLVPIRQRRVTVESLDLSHVRSTAGDLNAGDLERELIRDQVLHEVAAPLVELAGVRPTLVFCAGIDQAHAMAEVIGTYGGRAAALDGSTGSDARRELIAQFSTGEIQFLVNCSVLTEGFDAPAASCIAVARPTKSRALYAQIVGRGTRVLPGLVDQLPGASERRAAIAASAKPACLVLDFTGACAGRHVLVSTIDVLAGRRVDDDVRQAAATLSDGAHELDAGQLLIEATAEAESASRRTLRAKPQYKVADVDPFEVILGIDAGPENDNDNGTPASSGQIAALQRAGLKLDWPTVTRVRASALLSSLAERRAKGLCTAKQAMQLARRGLNPDVGFNDARIALDAIASNGWRTPHWLVVDARFRARQNGSAAA